MKVFFGILIFFLAFGWLVLIFSAVGLFYTGTVVLSILVSIFLSRMFLPRPNLGVSPRFGLGLVVISSAALISLATCYFATPTIFGGRDQGSIASAAIELSKNHNLKIESLIAHDLFQKYGPGKALNFPGFDYRKDGALVSRFPVGYTSYLSAYYNLFGLKGIQYANFAPLFLFLVIFWLTLREFFDKKISFAGFLIAATFFPFFWFAKYSLTEIYTLFLIWAGIYFLIQYRSQNQDRTLGESQGSVLVHSSLAFFALSALVRIEGIIFFLLAIIYVLFMSSRAKSRDLRELVNSKPLPIHEDSSTRSDKSELGRNDRKLIIIFAFFLIILYLFLNFPALSDSAKNFAKAFLPNSTKESIPSANLYSYLARIFFSYNILPYLILGLTGIIWSFCLSSRAKSRDLKISRLTAFTRNDKLVIFFILFPAFFYLITPQITLDDPWLLRRFVFAVFPALIFYTIYFLNKFFYHKIFLYITLTALIAANVAVSWRFFTQSENKDLLPQIEKVSARFGPDDLILVDRLASGSGFSLMSEPLRTIYGKNTVYFFNTEDLDYINQDRYENIYLIASLEEESPWYTELAKDKTPKNIEIITNNFLEPSEKKWTLAQNIEAQSLVGTWKIK